MIKNKDKVKILVSANIPTEKALKSFHIQLNKMMLNTEKKKTKFNSDTNKTVNIFI